MPPSQPATTAERLSRARRHEKIGTALLDAGDEWAVVPFFYSAYHLVRCAIMADPVWDDSVRLQGIDSMLERKHRLVARHDGGPPGPNQRIGVNQLVHALYPAIEIDYLLLHTGSISVRYGTGLGPSALEPAVASLEVVKSAYATGELVAPA